MHVSSESNDFMPNISVKKMRQLDAVSNSSAHTSLIRDVVRSLCEDKKSFLVLTDV